MRTMWTIVFVLAACGGGQSEKPDRNGPIEQAEMPPPPGKSGQPSATPAPAPEATSKSAAEDADQLNKQGKESMYANKFDDAELKFRSALALDPKPVYAFDLCVAQYSLGKFGEAMRACNIASASPETTLADKAKKLIVKIQDEAKKQGITLP